jgi:hypothetical protein
LTISGKPYLQVEAISRIASYNVVRDSTNATSNGAEASFVLQVQQGLDNTSFSVYGDGTFITGVVAIVGDQSGLRKEFQISIENK